MGSDPIGASSEQPRAAPAASQDDRNGTDVGLLSAPLDPELRRGLAGMIAGRLTANVTLRYLYPFLPHIARGLGISLEGAGRIAGLGELSGLSARVTGRWVDGGRRRSTMIAAMAAMGVGGLVAATAGGAAGFAVGIVVYGTAFTAYGLASNAWIGDTIPFAQRGRIVGLTEMSWAVAFFVGVPLAALLVDIGSWRTPLLAVAGANLVVALLLRELLPSDEHHQTPAALPGAERASRDPTALRAARLFAVVLGAMAGAAQLVLAVFGAWLEDAYDFAIGAIGLTALLFGLAELCGSGATVVLTDRIGKVRSVRFGLVALVPALAACAAAGERRVVALGVLFVIFAVFEFTLVSSLPLASEVDPDNRGAAIGLAIAAMTLGRALGTAGGVWIYTHHGIGTTGLVAAGVALVALVVSLVGLDDDRGRGPATLPATR